MHEEEEEVINVEEPQQELLFDASDEEEPQVDQPLIQELAIETTISPFNNHSTFKTLIRVSFILFFIIMGIIIIIFHKQLFAALNVTFQFLKKRFF
jgi:hypothetical protein